METEFPRRFMRIQEVKKIVGIGRCTIYSHIKNGDFPAQYKLGEVGRAVGWASDEIREWIESRTK